MTRADDMALAAGRQLAKAMAADTIGDMADDTLPKRPPNDRGQGRKPIAEGEETVTVSIRLTATQRDRLAALGGAAWIRAAIDAVPAPKPKARRKSGSAA
jgi:hypothetical protein